MTKSIIALMATIAATVGFAGDSAPFRLDTVTTSASPVGDSFAVSWDVQWIGGDANATVVIADNGTEVRRVTGAGEFTISNIGRHELTYTTYIGGVAQAETYSTVVYAKWKYEVEDGNAIITDTTQTAGAITIPDEIDGYPVTGIADGVFAGCDGLTDVTVPFALVERMADLFPDSYAKLQSVTLTGDGTEIPFDMFTGCTALTSVTMPGSVTRIAPGAFDGCTALVSVDLPATLTDWGLESLPPAMRKGYAYDASGLMIVNGWLLDCRNRSRSTLTVPEGTVGIGSRALAEMYDLETVKLPQSLKHIAEGAFQGDSYLDNLVIPDGVETVGPKAFEDCSYLQTLTSGKGVKSVGARAFAGCTQLSDIVFSDGLAEIGAEAFSGCWRMQSVSLALSTTNVASSAFDGCTSLTGVTTPTHCGRMSEWFAPVCSQILDVTVPLGETEIRDGMFKDCSNLRSVTLPGSVTNIAYEAFQGCASLPEILLPESLVAVGDSAFRNCSRLAAAVLPEGVVVLGASAFRGCGNLSELTLSRGLTELKEYAFADCGSLDSFVVPATVMRLGSRFCPSGTMAIYYLGNAPECAEDAYGNASWNLTSYVILGTKGWDGRPNSRDIPQSWNGRSITTWTANRFDVTFDGNGGRFVPVDATTYACEEVADTGYSLPPFEPVRPGYKFNGYWTESVAGTRITTSVRVKLTKAHTLYAHWLKGAVVKVRFNANGGTVTPGENEYVMEAPYGDLPVPTREHFKFDGWWTQAQGGTRVVVSSEVPKANHELFAHWTPCRYTIRFHANNGTGSTVDQSFTYGDTVTLRRNTFSLAYCQFAGWALEPGGKAAYADGKTLTDVSAVQDGVIHLYAVWTGDTYAVRFDSHGGVGRMDDQTFAVGVAQPLFKCAYTRTGFTFAGWAKSTTSAAVYRDCASVKDLTTANAAYVSLFAVWVVTGGGGDGWTACNVVFDAQGGTVSKGSRTITSGAQLETQPTATRKGYEFAGWWTSASGGSQVSDSTVVTKSVTYYAHWTANGGDDPAPPVVVASCTVKFNANGGSVSPTSRKVTKDNPVGALPDATRKGYKLVGWYTKKSGGSKIKTSTKVTKDVTYYAHWKAAWTVTLNANGGSLGEASNKVLVEKGKAVGALAKPTRKGYAFKGWYTKKSGGSKIKTSTKVTKNVTYYAQWTANKYKIKFDKNGGKGTMKTQSATYGKTVKLTANAFKKSGYKFAGWAKKKDGAVVYKNKAKVKNLTATSGKTVTLYAVWTKKSSSVKAAAVKSASAVAAAVPAWAVGTFYGGDGESLTAITVFASGEVSGKIFFAEETWALEGTADGQRIDAVVTDATGGSTAIGLLITELDDGRCRIESDDGSILAEQGL